MASRRGMGAALGLSKEQEAFIERGSSPEPTSIQTVEEQGVPTVELMAAEPVPTSSDTPSGQQMKRPSRKQTRQEREESAGLDFYSKTLVPLTTRLKAPTADALRRACLEQKLSRTSPNSQQEIVEIAVATWLNENKFL